MKPLTRMLIRHWSRLVYNIVCGLGWLVLPFVLIGAGFVTRAPTAIALLLVAAWVINACIEAVRSEMAYYWLGRQFAEEVYRRSQMKGFMRRLLETQPGSDEARWTVAEYPARGERVWLKQD